MHLRIKKVSDIVQKEKEPCLLINWIIGIERVRCDNNILVPWKRERTCKEWCGIKRGNTIALTNVSGLKNF